MSAPILKRVYHDDRLEPNWGDGVPQIAIGVFMILAMLMLLNNSVVLMVIFVPIVPGIIEGLRSVFTYPRVGRKQKMDSSPQRSILLSLLILALFAGLAWMFFLKGEFLPQTKSLLPWQWILGCIAFTLVAGLLARSRQSGNRKQLWYALCVALLAGGILFLKLGLHTVEYVVMGIGALNVIYGVITFILFIRKYPVMSDKQY